MLPDFPKLKREIHSHFLTALKLADPQLAPLTGMVPKRRYHEGEGGTLVREDGSVDATDPQRFSSEITYHHDEFGRISLRQAFERYRETIADLARQRETFAISKLKEAVEAVGNDIDAKGRSFSPDLILEALERLQVDFDEHGQPLWPTFVLAPEAVEKFTDAVKLLEKDPYRAKMELLVNQKRQDWHDRESRRKLVD